MATDAWFRTLSIINLVGAFHALIQALLLTCTRRGNRRAKRIMALFLLTLAIGMANGFITILGLYQSWTALVILVGPVALTYCPLFYFYVRAMSRQEFRWRPTQFLHFVPFLLGLICWSAFWLFGRDDPGRLGLWAWWIRSPWVPVGIMTGVQTIVYITLIVGVLREYSRMIKASFSTIDEINLHWLKWRLVVFAAIWAVGLATIALVVLDRRMVNLAGQILFLLVALNTFATGYRAQLQPEIFFGIAEDEPGRRYQHSPLTPERAALLKARLTEVMSRERPFLDPQLTLPKLAEHLGCPANHLSQVINEQLGRNFFDFVNQYRVEAAKSRLRQPGAEQVKMVTIAFECGFNSLATFNRVFKDLAGQTPTAYRLRPLQP